MSRAFTKEIDDVPEPALERPISAAPNLVTARGARLIEEKLGAVDVRLQQTTDPDEIAALRRDRRYWAARHATKQIVIAESDTLEVGFGATVEIRRGGRTMRFQIVGEDEADPDSGLIAWTAPIAVALDGARPGDIVEFGAAPQPEQLKVIRVDPSQPTA